MRATVLELLRSYANEPSEAVSLESMNYWPKECNHGIKLVYWSTERGERERERDCVCLFVCLFVWLVGWLVGWLAKFLQE